MNALERDDSEKPKGMRLCIADPPYLGRGVRIYGNASNKSFGVASGNHQMSADNHPEAHLWDDPTTHQALVEKLCDEYDGWAIAMAWDNLRHYLQWTPDNIWIGIWVRTSNSPPSTLRVRNTWEPVLVSPPKSRRLHNGPGTVISTVLSAPAPGTFVGEKPRAWTRWVLDMLGYDPEIDTVDDLFHGSGAVAAEVAQGVLL